MNRALRRPAIYRKRAIPLIMFCLLLAPRLVAETGAAPDWCGTQRIYEEKYLRHFGSALSLDPCDFYGPCDDPAVRDAWIPTGVEDTQYVRMIIHVLALDDGSNPYSTPEHVAGQVAQLNLDYAQVGIQFVYQINQVNSTAWRNLQESEIEAMKIATAIEPDRYLNVWVTIVDFSYSFGTFPWSYDALEATGGIVMGHFHWNDLPNRVFAHEVGHTLGLYHTFHGVDEVDACGPCYEVPSANSSVIGDLCADTPPTPTNAGPCSDYPGSDTCSGEPWGYTMPENYMGYASQTCLTTFTPQQRGRLRCWSNSVLDNWSEPFQVTANPPLGPVPLTVDLVATTHKVAIGWEYNLGDGTVATEETPSHTYDTPGLIDVSVDMQTADRSYGLTFPGLVSAYADTLTIGRERFDENIGRVDIDVHNYLPLGELEIPFVYEGPVAIRFDSVSKAGLRTDSMSVGLISRVDSWSTASILIGPGSAPLLPPGSGAVAGLYFTLLQPGASGSVPIEITSYPRHTLTFVTAAGQYVPEVQNGSLDISCCRGTVGDANGDGGADPTIGDVSVLIAHLFINGVPLDCYPEADANQSGGAMATAADLSIGDVSILIDHLFISGVPLADCL